MFTSNGSDKYKMRISYYLVTFLLFCAISQEVELNNGMYMIKCFITNLWPRRAALPDQATVTEVEFYLNKEAPFENLTDIYPGSRIHFSLTIHLPPSTDLLVELFTPDNDTTVMALCDVTITSCGSNIIQCPGLLNMEPYDQAIFNFGILNNTESDTSSYTPSSLVIEWDAVMVPNPETVDDAEYWISAGAEYASETMIWVGQTSVKVHTTTKVINNTGSGNGPESVLSG
ncbi:hypothetical protein LSH36_30g02001 [Paralvinella palmiformis]|uniref:Uncharacterized protein n=1 Tax=Paralvinella palmiformis TaxID=53620 RepID=A0AAD9K9Y1_9ANNE|nr:hypothetical protein LSH36_30g02001 [Paralvinella palmiformis]